MEQDNDKAFQTSTPSPPSTLSSFIEKLPLSDPVDGVESENLIHSDVKARGSSIFCGACQWLTMLGRELEQNYLFGVIVVYGMSQGVGGSLHRVVVEYYWKDVQLAQPASVQFYNVIVSIPWNLKPLWGLLTDLVPVAGYHRRPYFILAGFLGIVSCGGLVLGGKLHVPLAILLLVAGSASAAMAEVTIDAVSAKKCREHPDLASDIQTLCTMSVSIGRLIGFSLSGPAVKAFGAQEAIGFLLIQPILFFILAFLLHEPRVPRRLRQSKQINQSIWPATKKAWTTLKCPLVWKPTCYTFLSWALCPDITEGLFYYYTNPSLGLGFSQEVIGAIFAVGSVLSFLGALIYHKGLKRLTFRSLLFWTQLFLFLSGMLDLVLVTRLNEKLGIPDYFLAAGDESLAQALYRLKWMPIYILCARLCPAGIEGFFYALLVAIDLLGLRVSEWAGSALLNLTSVTRTNFKFLWVTVLIRNILRLLPMVLLFLVPNITANGEVLPPELVGASEEITDTDDENIQLVLQQHPSQKAINKPSL